MRTQAGLVMLLMGIAVGSRAQTVVKDSTETFDYRSLGSGGGRWMDQDLSAVPGVWSFGWENTPLGANRWTIGRSSGTGFGRTEIMLDGRPFRDPVTGEPDLAEIPASAVENIVLYRTDDSNGSSPIGGTLRIGTAGIPSRSPLTRMLYRNGGGKSDFGVLFGHRSPGRWELKSALDDQSYSGDAKRRLIRSNVTIWPGGPFELRYALRTGKNEFPSTTFQSAGSWYSAGRLRSDRIDHGVSALARLSSLDARIDFDRTSMDYRTDDPDSRASGKATSLRLIVDKTDSVLSLTGGAENLWRSLEWTSDSGKDRFLTAWADAGWTKGKNKLGVGIHGRWMERNRHALSLNGCLTHAFAVGTEAWAAWTEGVREPTLAEQLGKPLGWTGTAFEPTPDLGMETGRRAAFGVRTGLAGFKIGATVFHQQTNGMIQSTFGERMRYMNGGRYRHWGMDALIGVESATAGFVSKVSWIGIDGNPIWTPKWYGHASGYFGHAFFRDDLRIRISLAVRFWGAYDWNWATVRVDPSASADFKLSALVMNDFTFEFGVEDVFDSKDPVIGGVLQPGRRMWTGIVWNLYN